MKSLLIGPALVSCCFDSKTVLALVVVPLLTSNITFQAFPSDFAESIVTIAFISEVCPPRLLQGELWPPIPVKEYFNIVPG